MEDLTVTLGTWTIEEPLVLAEVVFSKSKLKEVLHIDQVRYGEQLKFTDEWYENAIELIKSDPTTNCSLDFAKEVLEIFSDEFGKISIEDGRDYILSNFYCDRIFNETTVDANTLIDGIIYPSVKYSFQEYNLALHPRAMKKISFNCATHVWVVHHAAQHSVQFIPLETSFKDKDGNIKWNRFKCDPD